MKIQNLSFDEKLTKLEKLYPVYDHLYLKLEKEYNRLESSLDVNLTEEEEQDFFGLIDAYARAEAQQPEVAAKMNRVRLLILKRDAQIEKRRKDILKSLSPNEAEQMIIS